MARARQNPAGSKYDVEDRIGGLSSLLDATRLVKPAAMPAVLGGGIGYWRNKAWTVTVDASDDATAHRVGSMIKKNLIAKRSVAASDPHLHDLPLYVMHRNGWVLVDAVAAAPAVKAPAASDVKHALSYKAKAYFGDNGATLGGAEGRYVLAIRPALAKHRGLFGEGTLRATTLAELDQKLDETILRIEAALAPRRR